MCIRDRGKVLAQADIPDETFAQGILGPGCGIEPTGDTVYAPFDGTVTQICLLYTSRCV